jgi:FSR family fosmidomycin resistance protein-like MFS transporter
MLTILKFIPKPEPQNTAGLNFWDSLKDSFAPVWKQIALLWIILVLRSFIDQSISTYLSFYYDRSGYSQVAIGFVIALIEVGGALSGLFCGYFADRLKSYKPLFYMSYLIACPILLLQLHASGIWVFINAFLAGSFIMATMPLGVAWAQQLAPKGRSMVSSLMMGLAWGVGGMLTPITGKFADLYGIKTALFFVAFMPLISLILIYGLPKEKSQKEHN